MLYTIGQVAELKSKAGNMYKRIDVKDPSGVVTNGVAVFSSSPFYSQVVTNAQVEAVLKENDYNGSKSYTLEAPYQPRTGGGKAMGTEMIKQKSEAIKAAQDSKVESIKTSSTFTAAWNTAIASFGGKGFTQDELAKEFKMWRRYFVNNYDVEDNPALTSHGTEVPWPEDKSSTLNNDSDGIEVSDIPF